MQYRATKHGKIMIMLSNINSRCYNEKSNSFEYYGSKGIQNYLTYEDISFLWDRDNAGQMATPSIDRIYADKDYVIGNCQIIENVENIVKERRKPVVQVALDGSIVKEWKSQADAEHEGGFDQGCISSCCRGKQDTPGGFRWMFAIERPIVKEEN